MSTLQTMNFDNLVLRELPIDESDDHRGRRQVKGACFARAGPTPVRNPMTVAYSVPALELLDLSEEEAQKTEFAEYFSGNKLLPGSETASHCYCGHQFGNFAGQLGDGAAIYLGEVVNKAGERWEMQLKGAGPTPFSRDGDGRKVLRSTIREFLCSEAMHHLGIPTTRAGACVTSDSTVIRDIFYSGNPIDEKCTIVLRIAPSFIRFGSFQICKPPDRMTGKEGPSVGRFDVLEKLAEYTIKTFYPAIWSAHKDNKIEAYNAFFREVVHRTARLVAEWQCVGWCHGVLNTDNMSIVGVTIDYGPYGFLDCYDSNFICNASDNNGRYTYKKQPEMCKWNCNKLADALGQIGADLRVMHDVIQEFDSVFEEYYLNKMRKKFGLRKEQPEDKQLVESFLDTMEKTGVDFTNCFRGLNKVALPGSPGAEGHGSDTALDFFLDQCNTLDDIRKANRPQMEPRQLQMMLTLLQTNPELLARLRAGHRLLTEELDRIERLQQLKNQTAEGKRAEDRGVWEQWFERYSQRLAEDTEGCGDLGAASSARIELMNSNNPRFVLRNYIAQQAIDAAEAGDYSEVRKVLRLLQHPFSDSVDLSDITSPPAVADETPDGASEGTCSSRRTHVDLATHDVRPPDWATDLKVT